MKLKQYLQVGIAAVICLTLLTACGGGGGSGPGPTPSSKTGTLTVKNTPPAS